MVGRMLLYDDWLTYLGFCCDAAFGFCEYECPEATLRCIRLLNEWEIAKKKLVVSVAHIALLS